jgi:hypothetical protein
VPGRGEDGVGGAAEVALGEGVERAAEPEGFDGQWLAPGQGEGDAVGVPGEGEIGDFGRPEEEGERLAGRRALADPERRRGCVGDGRRRRGGPRRPRTGPPARGTAFTAARPDRLKGPAAD